MNIDSSKYSDIIQSFLKQSEIGNQITNVEVYAAVTEKGKLSTGKPIQLIPLSQLSEIAKANETHEISKTFFAIKSKGDPQAKLQVVAHEDVAEEFRAHLAEGRQVSVLRPDGSKVTHDIHTISFTALKAEDFSVLERALNQLFSNLEEARKKAQAKALGKEVENLPNHVEVESSRIKDGKKVEAAKKRIVDPDMQKKAAEIVANNIARNMTKEQIKDQQAQEKEDKIKQTEEQRSERRQEIKQESIANQAQKLEIDREDEKISKKRKF